MTYGFNNALWLTSPFLFGAGFTIYNSGTILMSADGQEIAIKYFPQGASPVTAVDMNIGVTGTVTGINFKYRVESDNNDMPSGTVLGAATPEFAGPAASGFTGERTLATDTGNLTINVPMWLIMSRSSGGSLSGSNYVSMRGFAGANISLVRMRQYNGSNWTTTLPATTRGAVVVKHADGSYCGIPYTSSGLVSPVSAPDIYGSNRQGVRLKSGSQIRIPGVLLYQAKSNSPVDQVISVYEGSTLKYSETLPMSSIVSSTWQPAWFSSPSLLAADANIYIILSQSGGGGSDTNDYDLRVMTFSPAYLAASQAPDIAFVYGTSSDPTALTVSNTEIPSIIPFILDPALDLDMSAAGGGGISRGRQVLG